MMYEDFITAKGDKYVIKWHEVQEYVFTHFRNQKQRQRWVAGLQEWVNRKNSLQEEMGKK
jgi:hypothetical protein